jgi:uncharacterized membrane protein
MQIAGGIIIMLMIGAIILMTFMSYPTAIMYFALKVYRHARQIQEMQREQTARVTQEWIQELEK